MKTLALLLTLGLALTGAALAATPTAAACEFDCGTHCFVGWHERDVQGKTVAVPSVDCYA